MKIKTWGLCNAYSTTNIAWQNPVDNNATNNVSSMFSSNGNIYFGTFGQGLTIWNESQATSRVVKYTGTNNGIGSNMIKQVFTDKGCIYLATDNGISISTDGGYTWQNKHKSDGLVDNYDLSIYADGEDIYVGTYGYGLSISHDGGNSWENINTFNNNYIHSVLAQGNDVYAGTNNGLEVSHDGGKSWKEYSFGVIYAVRAIGKTVYASSVGKLQISYDGGNTWIEKSNGIDSGSPISSMNIEAGVIYLGLNHDGVAVSTDDGDHFVFYSSIHKDGTTDFIYSTYSLNGFFLVGTPNNLAYGYTS